MQNQPEERLRLPRKGEVFGIVMELYGGSRMLVECSDRKKRLCRIPGSIKKGVWIRNGDLVLVRPWSVESYEKGDIVYKYTRHQAEKLRSKGFLKQAEV